MGAEGIFGYSCLGISVTMTCPLRCDHCITSSSPDVREEMSAEEALGYMRAAAGAVDHVSITGGEPFLDRWRLETLVSEGKSLGYVMSVMTSGYWAEDEKKCRERLAALKRRGLDMVGVSLDRYHLPYISERACVNIARLCDELELPLAVRVIVANGDDYGDHVKQLLDDTGAEVNVNFMVKLGRAEGLDDGCFKCSSGPPRELCETVTAVDVVPGGDVYACCGPGAYMRPDNPLVLGNASEESLYHILQRGLRIPYLKVINTRGPVGLLEDLQAHGQGHLVKPRDNYTDGCQLCLDICNNPEAVAALDRIYADKAVKRRQSAAQFLKMAGERMRVDEFKRQRAQGA